MKNKNLFTFSPPPPYFTFPFHIRQSAKSPFLATVPGQSRTREIADKFLISLKNLTGIPDDYTAVLFNAEREFQSFMADSFFSNQSVHFLHGNKGRDFVQLLKTRKYHPASRMLHFDTDQDKMEPVKESLPLYLFLNEPETGTCLSTDWLKDTGLLHRKDPAHADITSVIPGISLNVSELNSFSFAFHTSFGIPFNEVIWFVKTEFFNRFYSAFGKRFPAGNLQELTGGFYSYGLPDLLFLDVSHKIIDDLIARSLKNIINETSYKAAILEHAVDANPAFVFAVREKSFRSLTTIVLAYQGESGDIIHLLGRYGAVVDPVGNRKDEQKIRITNFPVHSREQFEMLADLIAGLK